MEFRSKSSQHLIVNLFVFFTVFRGKEMLQFDDEDLSDIGGYDLVHHDDLAYVASAHQECKPNFKIVYRIVITHSQPSFDRPCIVPKNKNSELRL